MSQRVTGHTELLGLLAMPSRHSNSPLMHNSAFEKLGLDMVYVCFEVGLNEIQDAVKAIRTLKLVGCNVSMPNKKAVCRYLDRLSPAAELIGACNTIVNKNGMLEGHNTDGIGFISMLKDNGIELKGKRFTLAGCGGAGTAISIQAALEGAEEISIFNIHDEFWQNAELTVKKINENTSCKATLHSLEDKDDLKEEIKKGFMFVNSTGVGMKPMEGMTYIPSADFFPKDVFVADIIYSPTKTRTLELAEEAGCRFINGTSMMLFQGAAAFKLWTGKDMPVGYIKDVLGL
ncbi:MAG: shikimate dehydrogenase [Eubacterium sp.]|nr:shikimate dehydrogenase [Eubacterium sp.]MCD8239282.1 shikimate dehydrogenase [Clostridiales bacterium]